MVIKCFYKKIGFGVQVPFGASGGVEPYTFTIQKNVSGGTITPHGLYRGGFIAGRDIVRVTDADGETADFTISVITALQLVVDIIGSFMGLEEDQVTLFNQKPIPRDDNRLYVCISQMPGKPYSVKNQKIQTAGLDEKIIINNFCSVDITLYGRSIDALNRAQEVVMAVNSDYSNRQQSLNSFSLGKLPTSVVPLNNVEGASIPYYTNTSFNLHFLSYKQRPTEYFNPPYEREILTNE